jgi:hypothetical protein
MSLFAVVSVVSIGILSPSVAATSVDYYGLNGYAGNTVLYLSTGPSTDWPYILPSTNVSATQTASQEPNGVANAIFVGVGQSRETFYGNLVLHEYYNPTAGQLNFHIPVAVAAGQKTIYHPDPYGYPWAASVGCQKLFVTANNLPTAWEMLHTENTVALNNSGTAVVGTSRSDAAVDFWFGVLSNLPYVGYVIGAPATMKSLDVATGAVEYKTQGSSVYETYNVIKGDSAQNVFGPQIYVTMTIARSDFLTTTGNVDIFGQNFVSTWDVAWGGNPGCSWWQSAASGAHLTIPASPAVTLTGTVYGPEGTLKNQDVTLSQVYTDGPIITRYYHLKTDQNGRYRFFAELNKYYTASASYATSFGTVSDTRSVTTPNSPDSQTLDLMLPASKVQGTVRSSGGSVIPGAAVITTSPSAATYTTSTDSYGYYSLTVPAPATYTVKAVVGTSSDTRSVSVSGSNRIYSQDFWLAPNFGVSSSCSYVSLLTGGSQQTCTIAVRSYVGFVGTISLSTSVSPAVSGGPTASVSPNSVTLSADGQATSTLTITSGSATGQFVVRVTGISGLITQYVDVQVNVSAPGGGGGGICTPSHCPT